MNEICACLFNALPPIHLIYSFIIHIIRGNLGQKSSPLGFLLTCWPAVKGGRPPRGAGKADGVDEEEDAEGVGGDAEEEDGVGDEP